MKGHLYFYYTTPLLDVSRDKLSTRVGIVAGLRPVWAMGLHSGNTNDSKKKKKGRPIIYARRPRFPPPESPTFTYTRVSHLAFASCSHSLTPSAFRPPFAPPRHFPLTTFDLGTFRAYIGISHMYIRLAF